MQNVTAKISFTLTAADGTQLHNTALEYNGLGEDQVLFMERNMIDALAKMNGEAGEILKAKGQGKK